MNEEELKSIIDKHLKKLNEVIEKKEIDTKTLYELIKDSNYILENYSSLKLSKSKDLLSKIQEILEKIKNLKENLLNNIEDLKSKGKAEISYLKNQKM